MTQKKRKWLVEKERPDVIACMVDAKICKGCRYYGNISGIADKGRKCCDYTYLTGKLRRGDTAHCKVRKER